MNTPPVNGGFAIDNAQWLSLRPPIMRIDEWAPGADSLVRESRLVADCTLATDFEPTGLVRGPDGFWAIDNPASTAADPRATLVFWHGLVISSLTDVQQLEFAPR